MSGSATGASVVTRSEFKTREEADFLATTGFKPGTVGTDDVFFTDKEVSVNSTLIKKKSSTTTASPVPSTGSSSSLSSAVVVTTSSSATAQPASAAVTTSSGTLSSSTAVSTDSAAASTTAASSAVSSTAAVLSSTGATTSVTYSAQFGSQSSTSSCFPGTIYKTDKSCLKIVERRTASGSDSDDSEMESFKCQTFSGDRESDVVDFLRDVQSYIAIKKYGEGAAVQAIRLLLRGPAREFFDSLGDDCKDSVAAVERSLRKQYMVNKMPWTMQANVWEEKQKEGENFDNYYARIEKLARKAEMNDEMKRNALLHGMNCELRNAMLISGSANSLEDMRKIAMIVETGGGHENPMSDVKDSLRRLEKKFEDVTISPIEKPAAQPAARGNGGRGTWYGGRGRGFYNNRGRNDGSYQRTEKSDGQSYGRGQGWQRRGQGRGYSRNGRGRGAWNGSVQQSTQPQRNDRVPNNTSECSRCGSWERHAKTNDQQCPALKVECRKCFKIGHFAQCCRSRMNFAGN